MIARTGEIPIPYTPQSPLKQQQLYAFDVSQSKWLPYEQQSNCLFVPTAITILTWNVDFASPDSARRLNAVLGYLAVLLAVPDANPTVVLMQELNKFSFNALLEHPLVRRAYTLTDPDPLAWSVHYGTATLVPLSLAARTTSVLRVPFTNSTMGRDALLVELRLRTRTLRIANAHLESLARGGRARPAQLAVVAALLAGADAGVFGGDMNAISPGDARAPADAGLRDAWRSGDGPEGHTWGYWPPGRFPPGRLDKILYCARPGVDFRVNDARRVGVGLRLGSVGAEEHVGGRTGDDDAEWASDHCGLAVDVLLA